jgi:hypothetical protein
MNRKEEPQIPAAVTNSSQSNGAIERCSKDDPSGGGFVSGIGTRYRRLATRGLPGDVRVDKDVAWKDVARS